MNAEIEYLPMVHTGITTMRDYMRVTPDSCGDLTRTQGEVLNAVLSDSQINAALTHCFDVDDELRADMWKYTVTVVHHLADACGIVPAAATRQFPGVLIADAPRVHVGVETIRHILREVPELCGLTKNQGERIDQTMTRENIDHALEYRCEEDMQDSQQVYVRAVGEYLLAQPEIAAAFEDWMDTLPMRVALDQLTYRLGEVRTEWNTATDQWQNSDRGVAVQAWLTEMENKVREGSAIVEGSEVAAADE